MPEGDTIHKLAREIGAVLTGVRVKEVRTRERGAIDSLGGLEVMAVEAVGKHMLIRFAGGRAVRVHLGMKGRWRRYSPSIMSDPRASSATLALATAEVALLCFGASQVELLRDRELAAHPRLTRLGPDLLAEEVDESEILRRAREPWRKDQEIADLLLDQQVASGIGNVYKSEVLFLLRISPFTPIRALSDDTLLALYREARALMQKNLGLGPRVTTGRGGPSASWYGASRYYVYRRHRRPCMRCGTAIRSARQGDHARATFWCPRCQPEVPGPGAEPDNAGTGAGTAE